MMFSVSTQNQDVEPDLPTLLTTNAVPQYFTATYIRRTIDRIDSDIARTYGSGTLFFASREEAREARRNLQDTKRKYQSVLSAVRRITDDIWTRIFSFNAGEAEELVRYQLVCQSWLYAARHPSLWTTIGIILDYDSDFNQVRVRNLDCILDNFTLARPHLLNIEISHDLPAEVFEIGRCDVEQLPDKSRWRSLETEPGVLRVMMRRDSGFFFPSLEEVVVRSADGPSDDSDVEEVWMLDLPRLRRLTMEVRSVDIASIAVPWDQLTYLSIDAKYSDASDYLDILNACSATLEVCEITLNRSPYPPRLFPFSGGRLTMARMKTFKLMSMHCPALFLSFLRMPALEHLETVWEEEDSGAVFSPPAFAHEFGMAPGPGKRIADFVRASSCNIIKFVMQGKDVWFSDVGEALGAMRESVKDVTLRISNSSSMPAIDRELDIHTLDVPAHCIGDAEIGDGDEAHVLDRQPFLPHLEEFAIHSSFFAIPMAWFMRFVQPKTLTLYEPEEDACYLEENCVSFIYEYGSLSVISGYEGLTRGMLTGYIEGEGVRVLA